MSLETDIKAALSAVEDADALLITAGAGMGVDSGLPDFRGNEGFWNAYPEARKRGLSFSEMANPEWFERDPALAWAFYGHRLHLYRNTDPHRGFEMLLTLGHEKPGGYFVFTSNVDGQFQKAGFDDAHIEEVHGSIHHLQCLNDCRGKIWSAREIRVDVDMERFKAGNYPRCKYCGTIARPNILMFGDWGWNASRSDTQKRNLYQWLDTLEKRAYSLAIIEIGAGEAVPTVRLMGEKVAAALDATLIRINPRDYHLPARIKGVSLPMGGLEGISSICS